MQRFTSLKRACTMAVIAGAALASSAALAQQQFVNILTGGQSGVYYPMGVALSQIYAKSIPNVRATAQVTKASAENLNLLQAGRGELALALADSVSDAWKGEAEAGFPKKLDKLRGLSGTYSNYIQIVANADSGIKTLADLKGKRISVGAAKSGTELNARANQYAHALEIGPARGDRDLVDAVDDRLHLLDDAVELFEVAREP